MRTFHRHIVITALLAGCEVAGMLVLKGPASAMAKSVDPDGCERYCYDAPTAIPDGDTAGIVIGPVPTPKDGALMREIVLEVDISHGYAGDVTVELCYDVNGDGQAEVKVPIDLFRARVDAFTSQEALACPESLGGKYFFRDDNPIEAEDWNRATSGIPAESELAPSQALSVLRGFPSGGSFYLAVADTSAMHAGRVDAWSLLLQRTDPRLAQKTTGCDE